MNMYPQVKLKKGKDAAVRHRHPWIFSGALDGVPELEDGSLVEVVDSDGTVLGVGTWSGRNSISVRMLEFGRTTKIDAAWLTAMLKVAEERRHILGYGIGTPTDGYRLVFGESDGLPGLVVDRYGSALVLQISTAGMESLRPQVIEALETAFNPTGITERSEGTSRREEGLPDRSETVRGADAERVLFTENGLKFAAEPLKGQKTGFFLDQKDLRQEIRRLATGRRMLNLFSYTGASAIYALAGGATDTLNVDSSGPALELAPEQARLNGLDASRVRTTESDIFQFLSSASEPEWGMVVVDPPALIKSRNDSEEGMKAYHFLNRAALRLATDGAVFVTSSCSHWMSEDDLAFTLRRASVQAGVRLDLLRVIRQSPDHPSSVYFPESSYLKSFVCIVRK